MGIFGAFAATNHNENLVRTAEKILNEMVEDNTISVYLKNGGSDECIKLKPGLELQFVQIIPVEVVREPVEIVEKVKYKKENIDHD